MENGGPVERLHFEVHGHPPKRLDFVRASVRPLLSHNLDQDGHNTFKSSQKDRLELPSL